MRTADYNRWVMHDVERVSSEKYTGNSGSEFGSVVGNNVEAEVQELSDHD